MTEAIRESRTLIIEFSHETLDLRDLARLVRYLDFLAGDMTHLNLYRLRASEIPRRPDLPRPAVQALQLHSPLTIDLTGTGQLGEVLVILWYVIRNRQVFARLIPDMVRNWREGWDEDDAAKWAIEQRRSERDEQRAQFRARQAREQLDFRLAEALKPPPPAYRGPGEALQPSRPYQVPVAGSADTTDRLNERSVDDMRHLLDIGEPTSLRLDPPVDPAPPWLPSLLADGDTSVTTLAVRR